MIYTDYIWGEQLKIIPGSPVISGSISAKASDWWKQVNIAWDTLMESDETRRSMETEVSMQDISIILEVWTY